MSGKLVSYYSVSFVIAFILAKIALNDFCLRTLSIYFPSILSSRGFI